MQNRALSSALLLSLFSLAIASSVSADEGMWLYNRVPTRQLKEKYGF